MVEAPPSTVSHMQLGVFLQMSPRAARAEPRQTVTVEERAARAAMAMAAARAAVAAELGATLEQVAPAAPLPPAAMVLLAAVAAAVGAILKLTAAVSDSWAKAPMARAVSLTQAAAAPEERAAPQAGHRRWENTVAAALYSKR
jgi:hypothetical protein